MTKESLQMFKEYFNAILDEHNFYKMAENFFEKSEPHAGEFHFTKSELNDIKNWEEAHSFCEELHQQMWAIFRSKYGRDRKNDGKALEDKVFPFEIQFDPVRNRVKERRIEEMKKSGDYPFTN